MYHFVSRKKELSNESMDFDEDDEDEYDDDEDSFERPKTKDDFINSEVDYQEEVEDQNNE